MREIEPHEDGREEEDHRQVAQRVLGNVQALVDFDASAYEVDVIIACAPLSPWCVHEVFHGLIARGVLIASAREPGAFVVAAGAR